MEGKGYQKIEDFAGNAMKSVGDQVRPEKRFKHPDEYGAEFMPMVDSGICKPKECIRCEEYCLHEVYKVNAQEAKVDVKDENCIGCGICVGLCPEGAITLVNRCTEQPVLENRGTAKVYVGKQQEVHVTTTKRSTYGFRSYVTTQKTE
jgi:Fe-S-cluster-containing hydrogenase component 2